VHAPACLFSLRDGLGRSPLLNGHRHSDCVAQLMLDMKEVWRMMGLQVLFHIREQAWSLIARRLHHLTVEPRKGRLHKRLPGVVIPRLRRLLYHVEGGRVPTHDWFLNVQILTSRGFR
jgi:hypothetical protein